MLLLSRLRRSSRSARLPEKKGSAGLEKTNSNDVYRPFLINNVFNYYGNNGDGSYNKFSTDNEGFEFFKGDGKHIIFEDGVVWGGYHKGRATAKVGGSVYRHGIQAGKILTNGTATTDPVADDASLAKYRIYRVRPDIKPTMSFAELEAKITNEEVKFIGRYESYTAQDIYDQYVKDWNEWPAADGAPYTDVNNRREIRSRSRHSGTTGFRPDVVVYRERCERDARTQNLAGSPADRH